MKNKQSHVDGTISQNEINWLVRRAKGSFGIITTAASHVSKDGQGWEGEFGLYDDKFIDCLSLLSRSIKRYDSLIFAQLFHGGMRAPEHLTGFQPITASRTICEESKSSYTRMASDHDIWRIIQDFTSAAVRCVESGFDGIDLHGAHGYLISQFLSKTINKRTDKWGGDINGRSQFLIEIVNSIKNNVPENFIVGIRLSPEIEELNISLEDSIKLIRKVNHGFRFHSFILLGYICSFFTISKDPKRIAEWITHSIDNLPPIISTGKIWSAEDAQNAIDQGADLIGVARAAIPYPDWAKNIEETKYNPPKAPFSVQQLQDADLSAPFINYMRKWKGFVEDD